MPQAKTLKDSELKRVLQIASVGRNSQRNRIMLLISHWAGLRVGEIASLRIGDVLDSENNIKHEIWLDPSQTKGNKGRKIIFGEKLRKEIALYISNLKYKSPDNPLIYSQRLRSGFKANNLGQEFKRLYEKANISGATSHSDIQAYF